MDLNVRIVENLEEAIDHVNRYTTCLLYTSVLCVGEFYHFITMEVSESLAFFPLVPMFPFFYDVALYILGGGIVVGAIGSTISLKQYMKV